MEISSVHGWIESHQVASHSNSFQCEENSGQNQFLSWDLDRGRPFSVDRTRWMHCDNISPDPGEQGQYFISLDDPRVNRTDTNWIEVRSRLPGSGCVDLDALTTLNLKDPNRSRSGVRCPLGTENSSRRGFTAKERIKRGEESIARGSPGVPKNPCADAVSLTPNPGSCGIQQGVGQTG